MIRHIVAVKFPAETTRSARQQVLQALAEMCGLLDGVLDFQIRANVSPEDPVVRGFKDLFWFDFADTQTRDAYLEHPRHQALGAQLVAAADGGVDGIFVIDVEI